MSVLQQPGAEMLLAAMALLLAALVCHYAIRRWQTQGLRRDKAMQTEPPCDDLTTRASPPSLAYLTMRARAT